MTVTDHRLNFSYGTTRLTYRRLGSGPTVLLAFHGMGQDATLFLPFAQTGFTLYSIDLFYHGNSRPAAPDTLGKLPVLTKSDWQSLLAAFLHEHRIERFSVAGFSLGGRFALMTADLFADRLDELLLLAPDGITPNVWFRLATRRALGRRLFRFLLDHVPLFHRAGQALSRLGLVNKYALRFAETMLETPAQREQLYQTWTLLRRFSVDIPKLAAKLNEQNVRVRVFFGRFDRIVPLATARPLLRRLHSYELIVLKAGHNRLVERAADLLSRT